MSDEHAHGSAATFVSPARRLAWAALALVAILGLCLLRVRIHGDTTLADVYSDPAHFEGVFVDLATEAVIVSVEQTSFTLRELEREIRVHASVDPDDVGRFVHVRGVFHPAEGDAPAWIDPQGGVRVHRGRKWKIWLSLVPLVWVAGLLLATFRFDGSRLGFVARDAGRGDA